jgi:hypothetical protein
MTNLPQNPIQAPTRLLFSTNVLSEKSFDQVAPLDRGESWSNLVSGSRSPPEVLDVAQTHSPDALLHYRNDTAQVNINLENNI